jgi:hypothetical protein
MAKPSQNVGTSGYGRILAMLDEFGGARPVWQKNAHA